MTDLNAEIKELARERNAVILAHYYQEPDIQDIADGEVGELADFVRGCADDYESHGRCRLIRAADLLERQAAPQPIPVSERLPGPEDCDAEGRIWIHMPDIGTAPSWRLVDPREIGPYHSHWLPAHALPVLQS